MLGPYIYKTEKTGQTEKRLKGARIKEGYDAFYDTPRRSRIECHGITLGDIERREDTEAAAR